MLGFTIVLALSAGIPGSVPVVPGGGGSLVIDRVDVPDDAKAAARQEPETAPPGPADIKESVGIWFFLALMWSAIAVLTAVLVLKIKEADRLHRLRFYDSPRGKRFIDP